MTTSFQNKFVFTNVSVSENDLAVVADSEADLQRVERFAGTVARRRTFAGEYKLGQMRGGKCKM